MPRSRHERSRQPGPGPTRIRSAQGRDDRLGATRHDPARQISAAPQTHPSRHAADHRAGAGRWRCARAGAHPDAGSVRRTGPQAQSHRRHLHRRLVRRSLRLGALGPAHQGAHRGSAEPALRPDPLPAVGPLRAGAAVPQHPADPIVAAEARAAARPHAAVQGGARLRPPRHSTQGGGDGLLCPGADGAASSAICAARSPPAWHCPRCSPPSRATAAC